MTSAFDTVLDDMKDAMKAEAKDDQRWDDIRKYWEQIFEDREEALRRIFDLRIQGALSTDEVKHELEQERKTLEIQALAVKQMSEALIERVLNAALAVLRKALLDLI